MFKALKTKVDNFSMVGALVLANKTDRQTESETERLSSYAPLLLDKIDF